MILRAANFTFCCLAIICPAPTIADGTTDCHVSTNAFGATCTLTCDANYNAAAGTTLTCGDSNSDGTGDFNTLTCTRSGLYYTWNEKKKKKHK